MKTILILLMLSSPCFAKAIVVDRHVLSSEDHDAEVLVSTPNNKPTVIRYNVSKQIQDQKQLQPNVRTRWCDEKGCDDWKDEK